ncbi:hypothetical protein TNCV_2371091 [Trichonephila clavipes]|nr:hypothetical protein TNCV_2371091 [Trichonephila clavipes]
MTSLTILCVDGWRLDKSMEVQSVHVYEVGKLENGVSCSLELNVVEDLCTLCADMSDSFPRRLLKWRRECQLEWTSRKEEMKLGISSNPQGR